MPRARPKTNRTRGDSFVVHIAPPAASPPVVRIVRRRQSRVAGRVTEERTIATLGVKGAADADGVEKLARDIGMDILEASPVFRAWKEAAPAGASNGGKVVALLREIAGRGGRVSSLDYEALVRSVGYDSRGAGVLFKQYLRRAANGVELTDTGFEKIGEVHVPEAAPRRKLPAMLDIGGASLSDIVSELRG